MAGPKMGFQQIDPDNFEHCILSEPATLFLKIMSIRSMILAVMLAQGNQIMGTLQMHR